VATLTGGLDIGEHFPMPVGSFVSSNLTPAGRLRRWSDGEIFRAIRNSVDADGRWLMLMSYTNAGGLSDDDIRAVIAYMRSLPATGEQTPDPPGRLSLLGLVMLGAGLLPSGKPVITGHHRAAEGRDLSIRRIHPVVSGLPPVPRPALGPAASRGRSVRSDPTSIWSGTGSSRNSLPPCAPASIPMAASSADKCRGVRSDEWMMRNWQPSTNT
jgi:hypothetical protein